MNSLSPRMKLLAELVISGKPAADIGTDHGFVPIHLLAEYIVPYVILTDVNKGPLSIAKAHLDEAQIATEYYSLRLGNGLQPLDNAEVASVIIAGMGGELIESILDEDTQKSHSFERFVLQPRTHANTLRYYLSTHSFKLVDYRLVKEKGRICEIMAVEPSFESIDPDTKLVSDYLLSKRDPLIGEFIDYKLKSAKTVLDSLKSARADGSSDMFRTWDAIYADLTKIKESIND